MGWVTFSMQTIQCIQWDFRGEEQSIKDNEKELTETLQLVENMET